MTANAVRYPLTVVPVRYAVTFADADTAVAWPGLNGPTRAELASWIADRAVDEYRRVGLTHDAWQAARTYASAQLSLAEGYGSTELFSWDVPAILEAWQRPETQGEADDLSAFLAAAERHGLTEAELTAAVNADAADAELAEAAAAADGTLGPVASVPGPLTAWELDLSAERALAVRAARAAEAMADRAARAYAMAATPADAAAALAAHGEALTELAELADAEHRAEAAARTERATERAALAAERAAARAALAAELRANTEPADSPTSLTDAELGLALIGEAEAAAHAADAASAGRYAEADAWRALILAAGIAASARRTYARTGARYARDAAAEAVAARRVATRILAAILIGGTR